MSWFGFIDDRAIDKLDKIELYSSIKSLFLQRAEDIDLECTEVIERSNEQSLALTEQIKNTIIVIQSNESIE